MNPFKIEAEITDRQSMIIGIVGFIGLLLTWELIAYFDILKDTVLPSPREVLFSYPELFKKHLLGNMWFSVKLNFLGYIEAILYSVPIGFAMGLIPGVRALISKYFEALRYLPLPAVSIIFTALFGMEITMKIHFLSFGIMLYLIPTVVLRIDEIEQKHKQTITTLGASRWQKIRYLYFPYAMSKISDDIRVLVAISWTYIVIVELYNQQGGLGAMIFNSAKQSNTPAIYALVLLIIGLGYAQDLLFKQIDKWIHPYKYNSQTKRSVTKRLMSLIVKS